VWTARAEEAPIVVRFIRSSDADFVDLYVKRFNASAFTDRSGRTIEVDVESQSSGDTEGALCELPQETDCEQPAIWMPASTAWLELAGFGEPETEPGVVEHVVLSPQVVAVWQSADGSIDPRLPVEDGATVDLFRLLSRAVDDARGPFRFVHTDPTSSTSGLHAAVAVYAAASGQPDPTDLARIAADAGSVGVIERAQAFESLATSYCNTADDLLDRALAAEDPTAIFDAAYIQETSLVQHNEELDDGDPTTAPPLRALYPVDAPYVADYPIAVLDTEPWMLSDPALRDAAVTFVRWFVHHLDPNDHLADGFRSWDGTGGGLVQDAYGALENPPVPLAEPLEGQQDLASVQSGWTRDRTPVRVAVVVDASMAMGDDLRWKELAVQLNAELALGRLDETQVWALHDGETEVFRPPADAIDRSIRSLEPSGGAPLWDGLRAASRWLTDRADRDHIDVIVALTSGTDVGSEADQFDVAESWPALGGTVPLLVVRFGGSADPTVFGPLEQLVHLTNGRTLNRDDEVGDLASNLAKAC
jgi:hypothetical protein